MPRISRERPISKKQQWAGGRELWPGDPECVGCAGNLTRDGRRRRENREGGGLSPLHAGWNRYLPLLPAQPTAPTAPTASATLRCSPSRSSRRQADRPASRSLGAGGSRGNKSIACRAALCRPTAAANSTCSERRTCGAHFGSPASSQHRAKMFNIIAYSTWTR